MNLGHAQKNSTPRVDYDFSINDLLDFSPGKEWNPIKEKYKKFHEILQQDGPITLSKILISRKEYNLKAFVQTSNNTIIDSFITFPHYFVHDQLLTLFKGQFGNSYQFSYIKKSGIYEWKDNQKKILYSSTCTIFCFPLYIYQIAEGENRKAPITFKSFLRQLSRNN